MVEVWQLEGWWFDPCWNPLTICNLPLSKAFNFRLIQMDCPCKQVMMMFSDDIACQAWLWFKLRITNVF